MNITNIAHDLGAFASGHVEPELNSRLTNDIFAYIGIMGMGFELRHINRICLTRHPNIVAPEPEMNFIPTKVKLPEIEVPTFTLLSNDIYNNKGNYKVERMPRIKQKKRHKRKNKEQGKARQKQRKG